MTTILVTDSLVSFVAEQILQAVDSNHTYNGNWDNDPHHIDASSLRAPIGTSCTRYDTVSSRYCRDAENCWAGTWGDVISGCPSGDRGR